MDWKWDRTSCSKDFLTTRLETAYQHSAPRGWGDTVRSSRDSCASPSALKSLHDASCETKTADFESTVKVKDKLKTCMCVSGK